MNTENKKKRDINQSILNDIQSNDRSKMIKGFKKLSSKGNIEIIQPLIDIYSNSANNELQEEVKKTLSQLKTTKALPILIKNINNSDKRVTELVLHSIWSSNLDACDHIPLIVEAATKGDFMIALEALTLIENLEGPFKEEDLLEGMVHVNEYLSKKPDDKEDLIKSIANTLMQFEEQIQI